MLCVICIPKGFAFPGLVKKIRLSPDPPTRLLYRLKQWVDFFSEMAFFFLCSKSHDENTKSNTATEKE